MFSFGKRSVVFVLILFIVIALVGWAWRQRDSLPFITKPLMTIMSPFEYGASRVMDSLTSSIHIVDISLKNRIEWESLEKENADLKSRTVDYDEVVAENDRLRALLNFKSSHNQYQLLAGSVISRDYGTWTNTMIIDVGSGEGVEKDMPVITPSGVVGFIVVSGANGTLYNGVADGVGFTSITVAWLSQLNAFAMIVISALLAILEKGAETLQTAMQVPTSISDIVTGILLFCMLGCEFFINYRMIFRRKQVEAPAAPAAAESDQTESKEDASC